MRGESQSPLICQIQVLISSIKVEVKKKHSCAGWNFSCFAAHFVKQDLF